MMSARKSLPTCGTIGIVVTVFLAFMFIVTFESMSMMLVVMMGCWW